MLLGKQADIITPLHRRSAFRPVPHDTVIRALVFRQTGHLSKPVPYSSKTALNLGQPANDALICRHAPQCKRIVDTEQQKNAYVSFISICRGLLHDADMAGSSDKAPAKVAFGERLHTSIVACSYRSDAAFAKRIGISAGRLSNFINGRRWPEPELLGQMCEYLGCSADWLLYGKTGGLTVDFMERLRAAMPQTQ